MRKFNILAATALAFVAGPALAQPAAAPRFDRNAEITRQQVIDHADQRFARLDADNDGRATVDEARQAREQRRGDRAGRMFARLDANSDGSVSRAEFDQARDQRHERRAERRGHRGGHRGMRGHRRGGHGMRLERLFGEDGVVTRDELRERALARFDRLDGNHDGTLTPAERREGRERFREHRNQAD